MVQRLVQLVIQNGEPPPALSPQEVSKQRYGPCEKGETKTVQNVTEFPPHDIKPQSPAPNLYGKEDAPGWMRFGFFTDFSHSSASRSKEAMAAAHSCATLGADRDPPNEIPTITEKTGGGCRNVCTLSKRWKAPACCVCGSWMVANKFWVITWTAHGYHCPWRHLPS